MDRREFIINSALGIAGLVGLANSPVLAEDPTSKIRREIENLMKKSNVMINYSYIEPSGVGVTQYISPERIWEVDVSTQRLMEIKTCLEENAQILKGMGFTSRSFTTIYVSRD